MFRSGLVRIDGVDHAPRGPFSARLASTGGLLLPEPASPLPEPAAAGEPSWFVGLELDTALAPGPVRVEELVLDGQLAPAGAARCDANLVLWDVTDAARPRLLRQERRATSPRNDRTFLPLAWLLKPARVYRVLARVTELRASPPAAGTGSAVDVRGALSFANPSPCDPGAVLGAPLLADLAFFELRYRTAQGRAPAPR